MYWGYYSIFLGKKQTFFLDKIGIVWYKRMGRIIFVSIPEPTAQPRDYMDVITNQKVRYRPMTKQPEHDAILSCYDDLLRLALSKCNHQQDAEDQEVEAVLKKAQERSDEHEAEKKARMRKAPLPPNERDW